MTDLVWWKKAGIGALGGFALALLKLIDAKFFLASITTVESYAAYLTYFCYMLLGSVAAVFLADHELPTAKVRRSAFILGLLAPSVLLAIANQPFKAQGTTAEASPRIPSLGSLFVSSAYAQDRQPAVKSSAEASADSPSAPKFEVLSKASVQPSFSEALVSAIGRKDLSEVYAYVIGSASDKQKAIDTATKMNLLFSAQRPSTTDPILTRVVQFRGQPSYFVVLGDFGPKEQLTQRRLDATSSAIKSLGAEGSQSSIAQKDRKALADLLVNAPVVPARALSTER